MSYDERSYYAGRQQGHHDREGECQYLRGEIERLRAAMSKNYTKISQVADELREDNERLHAAIAASCGDGSRFETLQVCERAAKAEAERDELLAIRKLCIKALVHATGKSAEEVEAAPYGCADRIRAQRDELLAAWEEFRKQTRGSMTGRELSAFARMDQAVRLVAKTGGRK
jgi:hypothetical protein